MVSVAKNFDAPIKLLFPKEFQSAEYSMLGLGDIVIPGIMVAIVLRYDVQKHMIGYVDGSKGKMSHATGSPRFFYSCFIGYVIGIASTIVVMNVFNAAQPALLYIVPSVLACTFTHAWMVGETKALFHWSEAPATEEKDTVKKKEDESKSEEEEEEEPQEGVTTRRRRRVQRD
jgi:minor histocompatibility antigen H13